MSFIPYGNGLIRKDGEYPMFDGLGSGRTVTNSGQTVTGTIIQDGFGPTVAATGSSATPYKFAANRGIMTKAYTLIEILIAIVILAVLTALVLGIMGQARRNAMSTQCVSNAHQISASLTLYLQDYDGYYPLVDTRSASAKDLDTEFVSLFIQTPGLSSGFSACHTNAKMGGLALYRLRLEREPE